MAARFSFALTLFFRCWLPGIKGFSASDCDIVACCLLQLIKDFSCVRGESRFLLPHTHSLRVVEPEGYVEI